jgi:hypothetical protein
MGDASLVAVRDGGDYYLVSPRTLERALSGASVPREKKVRVRELVGNATRNGELRPVSRFTLRGAWSGAVVEEFVDPDFQSLADSLVR